MHANISPLKNALCALPNRRMAFQVSNEGNRIS
jgi:hypothetical protein